MFSIILSAIIGLVIGQQRTCEYEGGPNGRYTLNLTSISTYRLEYQTSNFFYVKSSNIYHNFRLDNIFNDLTRIILNT